MITCKNCKEEFEKGKFCPECGASINDKPSKGDEALSLLHNINERVEKMEFENQERKAKIEERKKKREEKPKDKSAGGESGGILSNLFGRSS